MTPVKLCGCPRCVELLLPPHTDLDVFLSGADYDSLHPLVCALKHSDTAILARLASHLPVSRRTGLAPDLRDSVLSHLVTAMVPASRCSLLCHLDPDWPLSGAEFLLSHGLTPDPADSEELPPLLAALWTNNVPLFQLLLRHRAKPNLYHKNVTGNVAMLLAFQKDLERDLSSVVVRNSRQPSFHAFYLWQLFLAGAESHSLFTAPVWEGGGPAVTNLFGLLFHMFHRRENLVPVLALLMYISDHASLPSHILGHFHQADRTKLQTISGESLVSVTSPS